MLSDLDRLASESKSRKRYTFVVGLDAAGAFDSASLSRLIETLLRYRVPTQITRLIGTWLTSRTFRVRLATPIGTVFSAHRNPSRGVPQGGVLSPLLWILRVNRIAKYTRSQMKRAIQEESSDWDLIVQIFAGDISAAISHEDRETVLEMAWTLKEILLEILGEIELDVSTPKCNNFLVDFLKEKLKTKTQGQIPKKRSLQYDIDKENKKNEMQFAIDKLLTETEMEKKRIGAPIPLEIQL